MLTSSKFLEPSIQKTCATEQMKMLIDPERFPRMSVKEILALTSAKAVEYDPLLGKYVAAYASIADLMADPAAQHILKEQRVRPIPPWRR